MTDEILDIVDENDRIIGTATKSACHQNSNLIHHTVHFTLLDKLNNKILTTIRGVQKLHDAGKLCFLGEHILSGETYEQAVVRGVMEELGFKPNVFINSGQNIFYQGNQTELVKFYVVDWNGESLNWDKNEIEEVRWVTISELLKLSPNYSEMTQYWINNTDWKSYILEKI